MTQGCKARIQRRSIEELDMRLWPLIGGALFASALVLPTPVFAHCDGLDGPVVAAARKALNSGDPNYVLIWVQPKDEAELRRAFTDTIAVRKLNP
jgi:hypothetical protein